MLDVILKYSTDYGPEEINLEGDKTSFGRGGEAQVRLEDDGLSRLHASVYREGERVWIVDENSTNGTFVNGQRVNPGGTPLSDGDVIRIGHKTDITINISDSSGPATNSNSFKNEIAADPTAASQSEEPSMMIPLLITGFALLIVCGAAVFIGLSVFGNNQTQTVETRDRYDDEDFDSESENGVDSESGNENNVNSSPDSNSTQSSENQPDGGDTGLTDSPEASDRGQSINLPPGKTYQTMNGGERNQYIKVKAEKVARIIGNNSSDSIPPQAIAKIRGFLDAYASRIGRSKKNDCSGSGWLSSDMVSILERARTNAPFIIRAFNQKGVDPQVGLYLAMIESEHCPCLQSYTGPLGMFQFTYATGKRFGLNVERNASPSNPDERCQPEPAARASALYMKSLTGRIGTGPLSIPLAIASYNSGEGGLGKNLRTALEANESQDRSFWTLVANSDQLAEQFQRENIKYVPKFFAAAIIGENPRDFGVSMQPLSTYTR